MSCKKVICEKCMVQIKECRCISLDPNYVKPIVYDICEKCSKTGKKILTQKNQDAVINKFIEENPKEFKELIGQAMLKKSKELVDPIVGKVVTRLEKKEHFLPNGETDFIETVTYDRNGQMIRRESTTGFGNVVYRDKDGNKLSRYSFIDFGVKKFDEDGNQYPVFSCTDCPIEGN